MSESEEKQKKSDNRDQALGEKIELYQKVTVTTHYTQKSRKAKSKLGLFGWMLVLTHVSGLIFFSTLFVFSYIPQTKKIVAIVMP